MLCVSVRDILQTIPAGRSCELDVEIEAHKEGLCERESVLYLADAQGLIERSVVFRAVGRR